MKQTIKSNDTFTIVGGGTLSVHIVEADHLIAMDLNGKSDPFVRLSGNFTSQTFQTHTKRKTLSPNWDETFPIYVGELEKNIILHFRVYDRDIVGQDFLGEMSINVHDTLASIDNHTFADWYYLQPKTAKGQVAPVGKGTDKGLGRIKIGLKYFPQTDSRGVILRIEPDKDYKFDKVLGQGAFGTVKKVIHKNSGQVYAAKIMEKRKIKPDYKNLLEREIHVMSRLRHPNIVLLEACYDTPKQVVLIMELVSGGELFQEIISREEPYYETDAIEYVRQLCSALEYMHSLGIAHRDLKPENLLLTEDKKTIKISDFGFSKDSTETLKTACGTALYVAPEVISAATYDTSCDLWSVGVITYILLSAHIPFDGKDEQEIFGKINHAHYSFPSSLFGNISETAKDFIRKIFVVDPKLRMTASDCLRHDWLTTRNSSTNALPAFRTKIAQFSESQANLRKNEPMKKPDSPSESTEEEESDSASD